MSDALKAILAAQGMVTKGVPAAATKPADAGEKQAILPTAKTRIALDVLANNTASSLAELRLDIRAFTNDLFAWSGLPRFSKPLMHKINALINDRARYQQNIELIAYAVAASRMLDADRLTRLLDTTVDTAYAPARYTLQLAHKLERTFEGYQPQRQEKLLISLWELSHKGRWWDIHAPQERVGRVDKTADEILAGFLDESLVYDRSNAIAVNKLGPKEEIVEKLHSYTRELQKGVAVNPDVAVYSSHLTWLPTAIRPESPVAAVVTTYLELRDLIDYNPPKAPEDFGKMYPNVQLYSGERFPYHPSILAAQGNHGRLRVEVIRTAGALEENRNYMGNCTGGYLQRLLKGTTFLLRIYDAQNNVYNAAASGSEGGRWTLGEINSRHNRGNVPADVRNLAATIVGNLPRVQLDPEYARIQELNEQIRQATEGQRKTRYRYKV